MRYEYVRVYFCQPSYGSVSGNLVTLNECLTILRRSGATKESQKLVIHLTVDVGYLKDTGYFASPRVF